MAFAMRLFAADRDSTLRGKLIQPSTLLTRDGRRIQLAGDASTMGVVKDVRVIGNDLEVIGTFNAPGEFEIGPIHTKSIYAVKNGQRLFITYWCEVCSIRTYTPGRCWCCQEETELDLKEHLEN